MAYLTDTNILLRSIQPHHPMHSEAVLAVTTLLAQGETVFFVPQNVREFWNVCTRPLVNNGLGMTTAQVIIEIVQLETLLTFAPDTPDVYKEWRRLVEEYSIVGVQVHDTNLVAAMKVHGITHLLTFNSTHFRRFSDIFVIEPHRILSAAQP